MGISGSKPVAAAGGDSQRRSLNALTGALGQGRSQQSGSRPGGVGDDAGAAKHNSKFLREVDDRLKEMEGATTTALKIGVDVPPVDMAISAGKAYGEAKDKSSLPPPYMVVAAAFARGFGELAVGELQAGLMIRAVATKATFAAMLSQEPDVAASWVRTFGVSEMTNVDKGIARVSFVLRGLVAIPNVSRVADIRSMWDNAVSLDEQTDAAREFINLDDDIPYLNRDTLIAGGKDVRCDDLLLKILLDVGGSRFAIAKAPRGKLAYTNAKGKGKGRQGEDDEDAD